jgi:hypothetical protein
MKRTRAHVTPMRCSSEWSGKHTHCCGVVWIVLGNGCLKRDGFSDYVVSLQTPQYDITDRGGTEGGSDVTHTCRHDAVVCLLSGAMCLCNVSSVKDPVRAAVFNMCCIFPHSHRRFPIFISLPLTITQLLFISLAFTASALKPSFIIPFNESSRKRTEQPVSCELPLVSPLCSY